MTVILNRPPNLKSNVIANLIGEGALANEKLASQFYNSHSGVRNLSRFIDINGMTVEASYRYFGGDATATTWAEEDGGATLTKVAVATPPTYNDGSPYHGGPLDDSCKLNASDYFKNATAVNQIGTEDFIVELFWKSLDETTYLLSTFGTNGYVCYQRNIGSGGIAIAVNDDDENIVITTLADATPAGTWNYGLVYVNRDEVSTNGSQWYINAVANGLGVDCSTAEKTMVSDHFSIGASGTGTLPSNANLAYCSMWKATDMIAAGAGGKAEVAALAASRYQQLTRTMPDFAKGTRTPTVAARAFSAHSEKMEPGRATSKLYFMGDNQIRVNSKLDKNGEYFEGVHLEPQVQNLAIQSGDASTTWALLDAGDTFDLDAIAGPDGSTVMDGFIADATDGIHGITQDVTMTAVSTAISCYAKKGNQTFICIEDAFFANGKAFFDIDNEVVGATPGAGIEALYMQPSKYNDTVRCIAIVTGTAAVHTVNFKVATADNDDTFAGDGAAVNAYMWGFQIECNGLGYATSYIPTVLATATRLADVLTYAGGANLGGEDIQQGTILLDVLFDDHDKSGNAYLLTLSDGGSSNDRIYLYASSADVATFQSAATAGNAGVSTAVGDIVDGEIHQLRARYKINNLVVANNGVDDTTPDVLCDMPDDLDTIHPGMHNVNVSQATCLIRNIRIYSDPDVEV